MGVITYSQEIPCTVAPARMFKALVLDSQNLLPKIIPQGIKSIEFIEGDGGVGSIKQTNFQEGSPIKYVKHKIDAIDADNYCSKFTMIEGDGLGDKFEFVTHEYKLEPSGKGCVAKLTSHYHAKVDVNEEEIKGAEEKAKGTFLIVEQHLIANPDLYA